MAEVSTDEGFLGRQKPRAVKIIGPQPAPARPLTIEERTIAEKIRIAMNKASHLQPSELDTGPRPSTKQLEQSHIFSSSGGPLTETQKRKFRRARRAARDHEAAFNARRAEERAKLAPPAEPPQSEPVREPSKPPSKTPLLDRIAAVRERTAFGK